MLAFSYINTKRSIIHFHVDNIHGQATSSIRDHRKCPLFRLQENGRKLNNIEDFMYMQYNIITLYHLYDIAQWF